MLFQEMILLYNKTKTNKFLRINKYLICPNYILIKICQILDQSQNNIKTIQILLKSKRFKLIKFDFLKLNIIVDKLMMNLLIFNLFKQHKVIIIMKYLIIIIKIF